MNPIYYLGIDGGATKTDLVLETESGSCAGTLRTGPCNPFDIGFDAAAARLAEAIHTVCGTRAPSDIVLFAGISGGASGDYPQRFAQFFDRFHFRAAFHGSDNENIVSAGLHGRSGVTLILGTGICAYRAANGSISRIAGWGYLIDRGGSGYDFGRDALQAAYAALDGTGCATRLSALIRRKTGLELNELLPRIYENGKSYIASFAPLVFEAAAQDDAAAQQIIVRNMRAAAHILETAVQPLSGTVPVVLAGGLTAQPGLPELLRAQLSNPERMQLETLTAAPVTGAVRLARERWAQRRAPQ